MVEGREFQKKKGQSEKRPGYVRAVLYRAVLRRPG